VGKTTVAAALALQLADAGERVLVVSVDPAHSLGDALGVELGPETRRIPGVQGLEALEVDAEHERARFLANYGESMTALIERGTYFTAADIEQVEGLTVPGMDEIAAVLRFARLNAEFDGRVIVDTAPTGHTLRLLDLPAEAIRWLDALAAMEAKHAAIASAFTGGYEPDAIANLLTTLRSDVDRVAIRLTDPEATRFVLVTSTEPVVLTETRAYRRQLEERGVGLGGVVVNRGAGSKGDLEIAEAVMVVPELDTPPTGPDGLRRFAGIVESDRLH